jgi:hypothetical protein
MSDPKDRKPSTGGVIFGYVIMTIIVVALVLPLSVFLTRLALGV